MINFMVTNLVLKRDRKQSPTNRTTKHEKGAIKYFNATLFKLTDTISC